MSKLTLGGVAFSTVATIGHCRRLKSVGVDMLGDTASAVSALLMDEEKFVSALYAFLEDQFPSGDERFRPEAFPFLLTGPAWLEAAEALKEGFADFFQARGDIQRATLIRKMSQAGAAAMEAIAEQLETLDLDAIRKKIGEDMRLNESVGSAIDAALATRTRGKQSSKRRVASA